MTHIDDAGETADLMLQTEIGANTKVEADQAAGGATQFLQYLIQGRFELIGGNAFLDGNLYDTLLRHMNDPFDWVGNAGRRTSAADNAATPVLRKRPSARFGTQQRASHDDGPPRV
jgi:hypothetical protein